MLIEIGAGLILLLASASCYMAGYLFGFNRGISFLSSSKPTPAMPFIKAFGKKEKRTPKSISEFDQWKREQRQAPADPG